LLNNEKRLHELKAVCRKIAKPRAAYDVAEIALKAARRGGRG